MFYVIEIVLQLYQLFLARTPIAIVHLCPASQPRLGRQAIAVKRVGLFQFRGEFFPLWSWSYQAHLTAQNIEDLRQLIQVYRTHEASDSCDSCIVFGGPHCMSCMLCISMHRAKFVHIKLLPPISQSLLAVENRAWRVKIDQ